MLMPATPLHCCVAYIINKVKVELVLPALLVGSVIPDFEPFFDFLTNGKFLPPRGLMHSLFGAVTLNTLLTVLITVFLYPPLVAWILKLEKKSVAEKCGFSGMLVLSALIGSLSHVLVDSTCHEYNPLLYPFVHESSDAFLIVSDWFLASGIVHSVLFVVLLAIFAYEIRKGTEGFWKRLLVG